MLGWPIAKVLGLALAASLLANLATWQGGRWYQSRLDAVAYRAQAKIAELEATKAALEKARDDAAGIVLRQAEATAREREARIDAERQGEEAEVEAARREEELNRKLADATNFTCPAIVQPKPAPPVVDCGLSSDDRNWLRRTYPPGPIRRPSGSAPRR